MQDLLQAIENNRRGKAQGIYSVCSAHPLVIEAAIEQAIADNTTVLIEATANQVNQFGGYTGMLPADFNKFVMGIASKLSFPLENVILGGDHLGPVCWTSEPPENAMEKARELIRQYVAAGFKKIHLDCSMSCAGDPTPLNDDIIAGRAADLCSVAEKTAISHFGKSDLIYIVGTEVPVPGGTNEAVLKVEVTKPKDALVTLQKHRAAFIDAGLGDVWPRVKGLVVQPGVEFSHTSVVQYNREDAKALTALISDVDHIVFEAHSTDYQKPENYSQLVEDHFAILKVGPQLTFALREALFALSYIEDNLIAEKDRSSLRDVCEDRMMAEPKHWAKYYQGNEAEQKFFRQFSYSDRIRYYWPDKAIVAAVDKMFANLKSTVIPLPLISQFLPEQYWGVVKGDLKNTPKDLVKARIRQVTNTYARACSLSAKKKGH